MSNSKLVTYTAKTNNYGYSGAKTGRGGAKIDKIFVHHMAGNLTVQQCGNVFKTREASAHYGINGKNIGLYVDESNTAWHCGNKAYNQRSIGIECANDGGASTNWHVSNTTIATLITLIVDICQRNGIKKINYTGNLNGNLCMHCWTASTACPGGYMKTKMKYIADEVNKKLTGSASSTTTTTTTTTTTAKKALYRVRKSWNDAKSQVGAFSDLANAKACADKNKCSVYDMNGKLIYTAATPALYRVRKSWDDANSQVGAYKDLANAKAACNKYVGYHVYDADGKLIYTSTKKATQTYAEIVAPLIDACKAQTTWMYNSTYKWQSKPTVAKSKTKGTCVTYVACVLQRIGVLSSGQYIWQNGAGYGKGKVYGDTNANMEIKYVGNKPASQLKSTLKLGDIVMIDDNKSGNAGGGGHTEIFAGSFNSSNKAKYYTGGTGSGHNTSNASYDDRKILAIVRIKNYKVTNTVTGGTITETKSYLAKQDATITYKASSGKKLSSVTVDGKAVDIKKYPTSYTFKGISANHTVKVVFK